jgi:molecular chaperone DnaK (HSP70)
VVAAAPGVSEGVRAVITVPAYFGTAEREATYQAGRIAGIDVLELLDEPVAAATHYGLSSAGERTVLVYDLGGGTFDTTVLRIAGGAVHTVATDGHHALGGADVDKRLLDLVIERLSDAMSADELDSLLDDPGLQAYLPAEVEATKRALSTRQTRTITVRAAANRVDITVSRADLEDACNDLLDTTSEIIQRVLATAREKGVGSIDDVVMVGGSSRIPALAEQLRSMLGVSPRLVEPDLAVAKGAALRAHQIVRTPQLAALGRAASTGASGAGQVTPVAPRAIGILVEDSFDPSGERSFVEHLVPANTSLPVSHREDRFGTILDDQESVRIQVYEQGGPVVSPEVEHNRQVLDGELTGIGTLPAGSVIGITVRIAIDGRLTVIATEPSSGRELALEAFVAGVVDTAETDRLTKLVSMTEVRG